jgi:hypothetical protein
VERPRVAIDEWMNALEPGDAWLRVAPIDRGWPVRKSACRMCDVCTVWCNPMWGRRRSKVYEPHDAASDDLTPGAAANAKLLREWREPRQRNRDGALLEPVEPVTLG